MITFNVEEDKTTGLSRPIWFLWLLCVQAVFTIVLGESAARVGDIVLVTLLCEPGCILNMINTPAIGRCVIDIGRLFCLLRFALTRPLSNVKFPTLQKDLVYRIGTLLK